MRFLFAVKKSKFVKIIIKKLKCISADGTDNPPAEELIDVIHVALKKKHKTTTADEFNMNIFNRLYLV